MSDAPHPREVAHLRPSDTMGALYLLLCTLLTAGGLALSQLRTFSFGWPPLGWLLWGLGQAVLAVALLQWFVLLHECGHGVLFRSAWPNRAVGHLAGFFSTIPFASWKPVHGLHHKWTGWQDLDPTTQSLVPRALKPFERALMNVCWRLWIPAFTVLYRVSNFWNLPRLARMERVFVGPVAINAVLLVLAYLVLLLVVGPIDLLFSVGLAFLASLMLIEPIMMSQHTHVPQKLSLGQPVSAFPAPEQAPFTRSLVFPAWISKVLLVGFDAHELHHVYPAVPGYRLSEIGWQPPNAHLWWRWMVRVRAMRGEDFLFKNRDQTGADV